MGFGQTRTGATCRVCNGTNDGTKGCCKGLVAAAGAAADASAIHREHSGVAAWPDTDPPIIDTNGGPVHWLDAGPRMRSMATWDTVDANVVAWAAGDPMAEVRVDAMRSKIATSEQLTDAMADPDPEVRAAALGNASMPAEIAARAFARPDATFAERLSALQGGGRTNVLSDLALRDPDPNIRAAVFKFDGRGEPSVTAGHVAQAINDPEDKVACAAIKNGAASSSQAAGVFANSSSQERRLAALASPAADETLAKQGFRKGNACKIAVLKGGGATDAMVAKAATSSNREVREAAVRSTAASGATLDAVIRDPGTDRWTVHQAIANPNTTADTLNWVQNNTFDPHWQKSARISMRRFS